MWNDGLDSLFVFTIERIKNEEGKASNLRATRMDSVAAKGFGTSASSFPGLLQAVLPCGDHGIVSYSITKHHHVTCHNVKKMPNKRFRDNPTWLLPIWSILSFSEFSDFFHQLRAKRKDGSFLPWKFVWDSRSLAGKFPHLSGHSRHTRLRPMQCRSLWFGSSMDSGIEE